MIIDFRVRPPYRDFCSMGALFAPRQEDLRTGLIFDQPTEGWGSRDQLSFKTFLHEMDDSGVDKAVAWGRQVVAPADPRQHFIAGSVSNDVVGQLIGEHGDRFFGFAGIETSDIPSALVELERCANLGLRGISLENPFASPPRYDDDEELYPLYAKASELGLICGLTLSGLIGPDLSYSDPVHLQRAALYFPQLTFVVSHGGWPHVLPMLAVALQCPNVYVCPDIYSSMPHMPGGDLYIDAANAGLWPRMLFGSGYPSRPIQEGVHAAKNAHWSSDKIRNAVMSGNARELLNLD